MVEFKKTIDNGWNEFRKKVILTKMDNRFRFLPEKIDDMKACEVFLTRALEENRLDGYIKYNYVRTGFSGQSYASIILHAQKFDFGGENFKRAVEVAESVGFSNCDGEMYVEFEFNLIEYIGGGV